MRISTEFSVHVYNFEPADFEKNKDEIIAILDKEFENYGEFKEVAEEEALDYWVRAKKRYTEDREVIENVKKQMDRIMTFNPNQFLIVDIKAKGIIQRISIEHEATAQSLLREHNIIGRECLLINTKTGEVKV